MSPEARDTASESPRGNTGASASRRHLMSGALVVGVVAFALLFVFSDVRELWRTASTLEPWLLIPPWSSGC